MVKKITTLAVGLSALVTLLMLVATRPKETAPVAKIGYVNSTAVMKQFSKTQLAVELLDSLQHQLAVQLNLKISEYKTKLATYEQAKDRMNEVIRKDHEESLRAMQSSISRFQKRGDSTLRATQQQLMQPIYEKFNKAVAKVARERGFTHILDNAATEKPFVLYGQKDTQLDSLVLIQLTRLAQ